MAAKCSPSEHRQLKRVTDAAMVETMRMALCFLLLASSTSVRKGSTAGKVKIKYKAKNLMLIIHEKIMDASRRQNTLH